MDFWFTVDFEHDVQNSGPMGSSLRFMAIVLRTFWGSRQPSGPFSGFPALEPTTEGGFRAYWVGVRATSKLSFIWLHPQRRFSELVRLEHVKMWDVR